MSPSCELFIASCILVKFPCPFGSTIMVFEGNFGVGWGVAVGDGVGVGIEVAFAWVPLGWLGGVVGVVV